MLLLKKMMVVKVKTLKESHELDGLCKGGKGTTASVRSMINESNNVHDLSPIESDEWDGLGSGAQCQY